MNGCLTQTPTANLASKFLKNKMAENEEIEKNWTEEQLHGEDVSKKDIIKYLHEHASFEVLATNLWGFGGAFWQFRPVFDNVALFCFLETMVFRASSKCSN